MKFPHHLALLAACLVTTASTFGQIWGIRPNIQDLELTPLEYTQLRMALYHHIDEQVLQDHCAQGAIYLVESDWSFLPFHRVYLEDLEDYLYSLGPPWRNWVPLPRWVPTTELPEELQFNDADCSTIGCGIFGGDPWLCGVTQNWNPIIGKPVYLQSAQQQGTENDLCDWNMDPISPPSANPDCCPNGLSRKIEYPHHFDLEETISGGIQVE